MNTEKKLFGIIPYVVSPIDTCGSVKERVLYQLCDHLIAEGVHGLCVLGSAGEFAYLNAEQKETIIKTAVSAANGRVPVVAGVSGFSTIEVCKSAQQAASLGVDAAVVLLQMYFPLAQEEIVSFYANVAQSVPQLPIVIYSNPKYMHFDIALDTFEKLAQYPNIKYYKDASGNTANILSLINRYKDRFAVFSASSHIPAFVSMIGGVGWMAGPACLVPRHSVLLYELCRDTQYEEAILLQKKLWEINRVFSKYDLVSCVKAGLQHLGFEVGDPIPPLKKLSGTQETEVFDVLDTLLQVPLSKSNLS